MDDNDEIVDDDDGNVLVNLFIELFCILFVKRKLMLFLYVKRRFACMM